MKHPIMSGLAVTAVLLAAGLVANAALERAAHETFDDLPRCGLCGRALVNGAYEVGEDDDAVLACRDCVEEATNHGDLPHWWVEE